MSDFKRRPFMAGHTDVFILSQPYITSTEHINSDGQLDSIETVLDDAISAGITPPIIELSFETEMGSGDWQLDLDPAATGEEDRTLAAIVANINATFGSSAPNPLVEASDYEGCLRIQSLGSGLVDTNGDGTPDTLSFIKILPSQSGLEDAAFLFGLPTDPHPEATVTAGDLAHAPGRPLTQVNRPGVAFLARGEDRVSQNFNRALHQLGINDDSLNTRLKTRVPVPAVIDIPSTSSRLQIDPVSGNILAVDLTYRGGTDTIDDVINPSSRVFVGGLSRFSTLADIAEYFSVQDQDDNQIQADERVVRVGAVINGYLPGVSTAPTFTSETALPSSALNDAVTYAPDYRSLLGVRVEKTAAVIITAVEDNSVIYCESATFSTDGVAPGDIVTISGSTVNAPINHNGEYIVDTVISETRLEIRPADHTSVHLLNSTESANLGSATVTTDGSFAQNCVLMFSPPLADYPPDRVSDDGSTVISGSLRIVLGVESFLGEVPHHFLTKSTVLTSAEMDAFVSRRIWRRMSFDGIYQGQSYDYRENGRTGGGAEGRITHGPITLDMQSAQGAQTTSSSKTGSGSLELRNHDLVLTVDLSADQLADSDIGKVVFLTDTGGTAFAAATPFVISEFLSYKEVRLTPPVDYKDWRATDLTSSTSVSYDIVDDGQAAIQAAMLFVANDENFYGERASKTGLVYVRNHRDGADDEESPGTSSLHLDRIRHLRGGLGGLTEIDARFLEVVVIDATTVMLKEAGSAARFVTTKFNSHIFGAVNPAITTGKRLHNGIGCTVLRIANGPNAGFYEIRAEGATSTYFTVSPIERAFDDINATRALNTSTGITEVANLYNVVFSVGGKREITDQVYGGQTVISGVTAFADSADKSAYGSATAVARAIQAHWKGEGTALCIRVNDPGFYNYSLQNPSTGPAIDIGLYAPADGIKVKVEASNSSSAAGRIYGLYVHADGYGADSRLSPLPATGVDFVSTSYTSAGGIFAQYGEDAGLVVGKFGGSATFANAKLSGSAALVIGRQSSGQSTAITGKGSAVETVGSIWVNSNEVGGSAAGGVYSEDSVGVGRALYPMWGDNSDYHELFYYTGTSTVRDSGWGSAPTFGRPAIVMPKDAKRLAAGTIPVGTLGPAQPALFNFDHSAVLTVENANDQEFVAPYSQYVGLVIEIVDAASSRNGDMFAITAVVAEGSQEIYFALRHATAVSTTESSIEFYLRGARWHQAYLDIADGFFVGTHVFSAFGGIGDPAETYSSLPFVTLGSQRETVDSTNNPHLILTTQTGGFTDISRLSRREASPAADGRPIFADRQQTTNLHQTDPHGGWEGTYDAPAYEHTYADETGEPRTGFYARPSIPLDKASSTHLYRDFVVEFSGVGGSNYSDKWGGTAKLTLNSGSPVDSCTIYQTGRKYQLTDHTELKVTIDLACVTLSSVFDALTSITAGLKTADGTTIVSDTKFAAGLPSFTLNELNRLEFTLSKDTLRNDSVADYAWNVNEAKVMVFVRLKGFTGHFCDWYIQNLFVEDMTRSLRVGAPITVEGSVAAHGFAYKDMTRGYQVVSPLEAKLFGGTDYAGTVAWQNQPSIIPTFTGTPYTQEMRGGVGLIRSYPSILSRWWVAKSRYEVEQIGDTTAVHLTYLNEAVESLSGQDSITLALNGDSSDGKNAWVIHYADGVVSTEPGSCQTWSGISFEVDRWQELWQDYVTNGWSMARSDALLRQFYNIRHESGYPTSDILTAAMSNLSRYLKALIDRDPWQDDAPEDQTAYKSVLSSLNLVNDEWYQPHVDTGKLFDVGINSATIKLYNGAFDPLWYALVSHMAHYGSTATQSSGGALDRTSYVPCGHTGFVVPLDVPHGSILTALHAHISIRPCSDTLGVYTCGYGTNISFTTLRDTDNWTEGVTVEVWRHCPLEIDEDMAEYAMYSTTLPERSAELIYSEDVSISKSIYNTSQTASKTVVEGDVNSSGEYTLAEYDIEVLKEVTKNIVIDLTGVDVSKTRVDRRAYSYFMTIKFVGGRRKETQDDDGTDIYVPCPISSPEFSTDGSGFALSNAHTDYDLPEVVALQLHPGTSIDWDDDDGDGVPNGLEGFVSAESKFKFAATKHQGPYRVESNELWTGFDGQDVDSEAYPIVKFRGARISWITDRAGDGGWGS